MKYLLSKRVSHIEQFYPPSAILAVGICRDACSSVSDKENPKMYATKYEPTS